MAPSKVESHRVSSRLLRYGFLTVCIAIALVLAVAFERWRARSIAAPQIHAIIVLPLHNNSGDPSQQYLADGMTEELIAELGKISALRVISITSSKNFGSSQNRFPEISRKLGVDGVVDGSVAREGDQIRITAQLIDARTGRGLWKNEYVRGMASALDLQSQMAREIAEQIRTKVTPEEQARLTPARPISAEAQDLYLQGRYFLDRGSSEREAIGYFEKAIEKDAFFAPAYAGLAASYNYLGQAGSINYSEAYSKAKAAAEKAIVIDPELADAHAALAYSLIDLDWDWTDAGREFRRALELNPNSGPVHSAYALYLARLGRSSEAMEEAERGLQLDPISLNAHHMVAYCYYGARQFDKALDQIRKASDLNLVTPDSWLHWTMGIIYRDKGSYKKAIEQFQVLGANPHYLGHLGNAYARDGQVTQARRIIAELKKNVRHDGVGTYEIALIYAGLGDKEAAFAWLERSYKVHDKGLTYLKMDPCMDPLRHDGRLQDLMHRVGLAG